MGQLRCPIGAIHVVLFGHMWAELRQTTRHLDIYSGLAPGFARLKDGGCLSRPESRDVRAWGRSPSLYRGRPEPHSEAESRLFDGLKGDVAPGMASRHASQFGPFLRIMDGGGNGERPGGRPVSLFGDKY